MQHYRSLKDIQIERAWLTIGSFDGIHLGHQEILRQLTRGAHAAGSPAVVLTFYPHPAVVLGKRKRAFYLTTPDEQAELLDALSIDLLITHPFDQVVASLSAHQFLNRLIDHLGLSQLWVGHDFAMGHNREGDVPALRRLGELHDFQVQVISPVMLEGEVVSSSRIRALLAAGDLAQANRLLGRPYQLSGMVVHGQGRGRTLGIPTANLTVSEERALLQTGVYACRARVHDRWHFGVFTTEPPRQPVSSDRLRRECGRILDAGVLESTSVINPEMRKRLTLRGGRKDRTRFRESANSVGVPSVARPVRESDLFRDDCGRQHRGELRWCASCRIGRDSVNLTGANRRLDTPEKLMEDTNSLGRFWWQIGRMIATPEPISVQRTPTAVMT